MDQDLDPGVEPVVEWRCLQTGRLLRRLVPAGPSGAQARAWTWALRLAPNDVHALASQVGPGEGPGLGREAAGRQGGWEQCWAVGWQSRGQGRGEASVRVLSARLSGDEWAEGRGAGAGAHAEWN